MPAKIITNFFRYRGTAGATAAYFCGAGFLGDPTELPWSALGMRMGDWGRRSLARELDGSGLHW